MSKINTPPRQTHHLDTRSESLRSANIQEAPNHSDFPDLTKFEAGSFASQYPAMRAEPMKVIEQCKTAFRMLHNGYHRQLYELLALAYGFGHLICRDDSLMQEFLCNPFWKHRTYQVKSEPLQLAMQFCLDAPNDTPSYHRACKYTRALLPPFIANVQMEDIVDYIAESGGIEKLAEPRAAQATSLVDPGPQIRSTPTDQDEDDDTSDGEAASNRSSDPPAATDGHEPQRATKTAKLAHFNPDTDVAISNNAALLEDVLNSHEDGILFIAAKIRGRPGEWRDIDVFAANVESVEKTGKRKK